METRLREGLQNEFVDLQYINKSKSHYEMKLSHNASQLVRFINKNRDLSLQILKIEGAIIYAQKTQYDAEPEKQNSHLLTINQPEPLKLFIEDLFYHPYMTLGVLNTNDSHIAYYLHLPGLLQHPQKITTGKSIKIKLNSESLKEISLGERLWVMVTLDSTLTEVLLRVPVLITSKKQEDIKNKNNSILVLEPQKLPQELLEIQKFILTQKKESPLDIPPVMEYLIDLFAILTNENLKINSNPIISNKSHKAAQVYQNIENTWKVKNGNPLDIALLLRAMLTELNLESILFQDINQPDNVVLFVNTGLLSNNRMAIHPNKSMAVDYKNSVWIPINSAFLQTGFLKSWIEGGKLYTAFIEQNHLMRRFQDPEAGFILLPGQMEITSESNYLISRQSILGEYRMIRLNYQEAIKQTILQIEKQKNQSKQDDLKWIYCEVFLKEWDKATAKLNKLLGRGMSPRMLSNGAVIQILKGAVGPAMKSLDSLVAVDPDFGIAWNRAMASYWGFSADQLSQKVAYQKIKISGKWNDQIEGLYWLNKKSESRNIYLSNEYAKPRSFIQTESLQLHLAKSPIATKPSLPVGGFHNADIEQWRQLFYLIFWYFE